MQTFDFDAAVTMHKAWKMKFHLAIDSIRGGDYDTRPIGDDALCALGQWLSANAGELRKFPSAGELAAVHQDFHRRSEGIADDIRKGRILQLSDRAIVDFGALSEKIEALLRQLEQEVRDAG